VTARQDFQSKTPDETKLLTFDYSSDLGAGETISSTAVSCVVWSGTDASPSSMISGSATTSGALVTQLFAGGLAGMIYLVRVLATTSLGQVLPKAGYLAVVAAQPG
jgi:hypothetical protein